MMKKLYLIVLFLFSTFMNYAQDKKCYTYEMLEEEIKVNPKRLETIDQIERHTKSYINQPSLRSNQIITIPVVVHIVYNTSEENVSDDMVKKQIDVLNKDFRRKNTDANNNWPQAADVEIEFCLAKFDPSGNPTVGITRTKTVRTSFATTGNRVKYSQLSGANGWPSDSYLNIWVCNLTGSIIGYAQFPGGNPVTDGIVVSYRSFGVGSHLKPGFQYGRTATHEVGHWLNLHHTWGTGGCSYTDFVDDTPLISTASLGCPKGKISCSTPDMIENYMDYTNDECMSVFTKGQKDRMRALFSSGGARHSILSSKGCTNNAVTSSPPSPSTTTCSEVKVDIVLDNYPRETTWDIKDKNGSIVGKSNSYANTHRNTNVTQSLCLPAGCYTFTIFDQYGDGICCSQGNGSFKLLLDQKSVFSGGQFGKSTSYNFCTSNNIGQANTESNRLETDQVLVYPNPVTDILFIHSQSQISQYQVIDVQGKVIMQNDVNDYVGQIDCAEILNGTYAVKIKTKEAVIMKKIVKN